MSAAAPAEPLDLSELLHSDFNAAYFDELVRRYARSSVSGVMAKFLAPEATEAIAGRGRRFEAAAMSRWG